MKNLTKLATFALATTLAPAAAFAGAGGVSANATLEVIPVGTVKFEVGDMEADEDMAVAYGIAGQVDYWVTDAISIGFAPRYILNVITDDADEDDEAGSQLDLAVRAQYNHTVNPTLQVFGFLAPAYSLIMLPDGAEIDPAGLALGLGVGGRYGLNEKLFVQGELGYQLGFQGGEEQGQDYTFSTSFLHIGVGIGSHF